MTSAEEVAAGTPSGQSHGVPSREVAVTAGESAAGWLWTPPEQQLPQPPVLTRLTELPVQELSWENAERLFLRMLERVASVQWAKLYGTRGQDQQGIDAYARLRPATPAAGNLGTGTSGTTGRHYAVLQSRRVQRLSASDIDAAIADFLAGDWPAETGTYFFATSFDLTDTRLDEALRRAAESLGEVGIEFVPWGAAQVSDLLRTHPELVDDFFGRGWVEPFCGPEGLARVRDRLAFEDVQTLRQRLGVLYGAVFEAQNAVPRPAARARAVARAGTDAETETETENDFIVVDVGPRSAEAANWDGGLATGFGSGTRGGTGLAEPGSRGRRALGRPNFVGGDFMRPGSVSGSEVSVAGEGPDLFVASTSLGRPRRSLRAVEQLLGEQTATEIDNRFREPADGWLARGRRNLLVGAPGSGKSSLLRFVARDLLSANPQSGVLHQVHGGRLPVWLPFGFLCRHLDDSESNSLNSAIRAWLQGRGMVELWPLVQRALDDDRLMLLVDGIDEWKSQGSANHALGVVETFLGHHTEAAALMSSRPYAVDRLAFALAWQRADVTELDDKQRHAMAAQYLAPPGDGTGAEPGGAASEVVSAWHRAHVEPFLDELDSVPELSALARTPLFLALLATTWRGEPLPPKRYQLYDKVVDLMVRLHPQMRRRFSTVVEHPLDEREFKVLMEAVAYLLVLDGRTDPVPVQQMQRLVQQALCDDDVLGYPASAARDMATAAMRMAEDEFGLLVPQGADSVGFIHRVLLDHLAGRRLARLSSGEQVRVFDERLADPAWLDVLLSCLTAQSNPPAVGELIDGLLRGLVGSRQGAGAPRAWPDDIRQHQATLELLAHAIAAEVDFAPRKAAEYLDRLVKQVETSPALEHRAEVVSALVKACANAGHRRRLLPTFKRWLDATRPFPGAAIYTLRDLAVSDKRAEAILVRAMRDDAGEVRGNAAHAYAQRFGAPRPATEEAAGQAAEQPDAARLDRLVQLVREGPTVGAQAAGLLAMATGWPDEPATQEHLEWGRRESRVTLRTTALYLTVQAEPQTPVEALLSEDEIEWVLGHLYEERWFPEHDWTAMTNELVIKVVAEASDGVRAELADLALETLRTNGRSGGNRDLCWRLACGPLADDDRLRDWVASELSGAEERPLILFNLNLIPQAWRAQPAMARALASYVDKEITDITGSAVEISESLPREQARDALLRGLDGFRPQRVARRLINEHGHDEEVLSVLRECLSEDAGASRFSSVAVEVLGIEAGFERIYGLLRASLEADSELRGEGQVLLAGAVATQWRLMREAVAAADGAENQDRAGDPGTPDLPGPAGTAANERLVEARRVLEAHEESEVCAACTKVEAHLGWHIADVIYTWPELTADYAIAALRSDRHVTEGIVDTIHSAALRAHTERPGPDSPRVVELALDLMLFLEPQMREVLAHELCRSSVPAAELLDVLGAWKNDKDDGVRRTVAVGVTQALLRHQSRSGDDGTGPVVPEMAVWRESVRQDLCSYGPALDQNRRNAWVSMLMLADLSLIDGLRETIGEPSEPGVDLGDIYGVPDALLVALVADRWGDLRSHFGDDLLTRLSASRLKSQGRSRELKAVEALASVIDRSEGVSELVRKHVRQQEAAKQAGGGAGDGGLAGADGGERWDLRLATSVIDARKHETGGDRVSLDLVLEAADTAQRRGVDRHDHVTRWALGHLLDVESWHVSSEEVGQALASGPAQSPVHPGRRALLAGLESGEERLGADSAARLNAWDFERAWLDEEFSLRRTAWTLLFPDDPLTQRWLGALGAWFSQGPERAGEPASWLEVCALCLGAAPAADLPVIVERLFHPMRLEYLHDSLWELTVPLMHRLRHDSDAVASLRRGVAEDAVPDGSPLFAPGSTPDRALRAATGGSGAETGGE